MIEFIQTNLSTIIIATVVFGGIAAGIIVTIRKRLAGKGSSCSCGCDDCPRSK
ncbi:hypothetical protein FACS1894105_00310 [Clostridia bacterium]|nr:hypothetical protein FACS1894105_00310 [Clostridia bacterium]